MAEPTALSVAQIAASALTDTNTCPQCGGNVQLVLQYTARRAFFRVVQNGQAEPEQYSPEVRTYLESVACAACATRFVGIADVDFETKKALIAARQELAERDSPVSPPAAMPVTVH